MFAFINYSTQTGGCAKGEQYEPFSNLEALGPNQACPLLRHRQRISATAIFIVKMRTSIVKYIQLIGKWMKKIEIKKQSETTPATPKLFMVRYSATSPILFEAYRCSKGVHPVFSLWKSGWKNLSVYVEVVYVLFLGKQ